MTPGKEAYRQTDRLDSDNILGASESGKLSPLNPRDLGPPDFSKEGAQIFSSDLRSLIECLQLF